MQATHGSDLYIYEKTGAEAHRAWRVQYLRGRVTLALIHRESVLGIRLLAFWSLYHMQIY